MGSHNLIVKDIEPSSTLPPSPPLPNNGMGLRWVVWYYRTLLPAASRAQIHHMQVRRSVCRVCRNWRRWWKE